MPALRTKYIEPNCQEKETANLLAHAWVLLAEHVLDLGMTTQAQMVYDKARFFYLFTGSEDEAVRVGDKLSEINNS